MRVKTKEGEGKYVAVVEILLEAEEYEQLTKGKVALFDGSETVVRRRNAPMGEAAVFLAALAESLHNHAQRIEVA